MVRFSVATGAGWTSLLPPAASLIGRLAGPATVRLGASDRNPGNSAGKIIAFALPPFVQSALTAMVRQEASLRPEYGWVRTDPPSIEGVHDVQHDDDGTYGNGHA